MTECIEPLTNRQIDAIISVALGIWFISSTWYLQVRLGNYLKHVHPKSWLRKIWWSMCDVDGICELCESKVTKQYLWKKGLSYEEQVRWFNSKDWKDMPPELKKVIRQRTNEDT